MSNTMRVGLVADYNAAIVAHRAIPIALNLAAESVGIEVDARWIPTSEIEGAARLAAFDGLWCAPGSPYQNMNGALIGIRHARENGIPFLGTCGGFQHAVVEYARNALGWQDADHAESAPNAGRSVIAPLACALVGASGVVQFAPNSRIARAYAAESATETYQCSYGMNPEFRAALLAGPLRATATDAASDVRAIELDDHPFFVATLFQPERLALAGQVPPLVRAFLRACGAPAAG